MTVRAPIAPGKVSGMRDVPRHIARPEYVGKPAPARFTGSEVKTPELIERMRVACRLAADALVVAGEHVKPGVTTEHIDQVVHEYLCDHGAYPSTLGYRGFPQACSPSPTEVI